MTNGMTVEQIRRGVDLPPLFWEHDESRILQKPAAQAAYRWIMDELTQGGYISMVTEFCPNCESEITMVWNPKSDGYKAYCPVCGHRLMLCDECQHRNGRYCDDCDYDSDTDTCRFNRGDAEQWGGETNG